MQSTGEVECQHREDQNGFDPEASVLDAPEHCPAKGGGIDTAAGDDAPITR
jgi:hypothetical protein